MTQRQLCHLLGSWRSVLAASWSCCFHSLCQPLMSVQIPSSGLSINFILPSFNVGAQSGFVASYNADGFPEEKKQTSVWCGATLVMHVRRSHFISHKWGFHHRIECINVNRLYCDISRGFRILCCPALGDGVIWRTSTKCHFSGVSQCLFASRESIWKEMIMNISFQVRGPSKRHHRPALCGYEFRRFRQLDNTE